MGDEQYREVLFTAQPFKEPEDRRLGDNVERRRRLVGEDELGFAGEGDGDRGALFLPAGKFVGIARGDLGGKLDLREQLGDPPFGGLAFEAEVQLQHLAQVAADRHHRREGVERPLRNEGDLTLAQGGHFVFGNAQDAAPLI